MKLTRAAFFLFFLIAAPHPGSAFDTRFWTWHRQQQLDDTERKELQAFQSDTIYWYVGEMENRDGKWLWKAPPIHPQSSSKGLRVIPVVRLTSFVRSPFSAEATEGLIAKLQGIAPNELQIDTDCPDRLLADFAGALKKIHGRIPWLSVTALAGWSRHPAWGQLQESVDEIVPMFYDVQIDPPVKGDGGPLPLTDAAKVDALLESWKACKIPWRAGLPMFSRLTIYDGQSGLSRGHIRDWSWDDLCFDRSLSTVRDMRLGTTVLRADAPVLVSDVPVRKGDLIGVRWPDRDALAKTMEAVKKSGAAGAVFFRLPDSTDTSGWSLQQLSHLDSQPHFILRRQGENGLALINDAPSDLAPRLSGKDAHDRGYAIEIEAGGTVFREALEGDFWRVDGSVETASGAKSCAISLATRLTFRFSHMRAGQILKTGLIQLAPGVNFGQIRYRILNVPGDMAWKDIQE